MRIIYTVRSVIEGRDQTRWFIHLTELDSPLSRCAICVRPNAASASSSPSGGSPAATSQPHRRRTTGIRYQRTHPVRSVLVQTRAPGTRRGSMRQPSGGWPRRATWTASSTRCRRCGCAGWRAPRKPSSRPSVPSPARAPPTARSRRSTAPATSAAAPPACGSTTTCSTRCSGRTWSGRSCRCTTT